MITMFLNNNNNTKENMNLRGEKHYRSLTFVTNFYILDMHPTKKKKQQQTYA